MNEHDSAKLRKILSPSYEMVSHIKDAALVLVNTCSVREKPEQKLFSYLGALAPFKLRNPSLLVGVGGCVAQQEGREIIRKSRIVDFVFGTHNLSLVPSLIEQVKGGGGPQIAVDYRDEWEDLPPGFVETDRVSVLVSISRGCNKKCSYCIVPRTRGREVSRPADEILREVSLAVRRGAREVTLLGQNVNSYGRDVRGGVRFARLVEEVSTIDGLCRIRFTSPYPQDVDADFLDLCTVNPKVCHHMHLPLQSGSNSILRAMRRSYTREKYISIAEELRARVPDISFTTDIIVGFPGETETDFLDTVEMVRTVQFDSSFSFVFSPRPGTVAEKLPGHLPDDEKLERLKHLQSVQESVTTSRLAQWVGRRGDVLIEGPSAQQETVLQGRLSQNITVNLDKEYSLVKPGNIVPVEITSAGRHTLKGLLAE